MTAKLAQVFISIMGQSIPQQSCASTVRGPSAIELVFAEITTSPQPMFA
jgi:hypothetical protein